MFTKIKNRLKTRRNVDRLRLARRARSIAIQRPLTYSVPRWKSSFRHILVLDTSCASDNIGDEIIYRSTRKFVDAYFPNAYISTASSHDGLGSFSRRAAQTADIVFLIGTNALSADYHLNRDFIWNIKSEDVHCLENKVVLFGTGANKNFGGLDSNQIELLRILLSDQYTHSTRDDLGAQIVEASGRRALNTSCPTLWDLPKAEKRETPKKVCFTLTKHKQNPLDKKFIEMLAESYEEIFFWPQQPRDLDYLEELHLRDVVYVVPPNLRSYDDLLTREAIDVVGTRLHGTIRALQHRQRGIVISIDNRAHEISRATGLTSVARERVESDLPEILKMHNWSLPKLDRKSIDTFLGQFASSPD